MALSELPEKKYLRPDEVAAFWSVSVKTVYRWIDMGILSSRKIGKVVRIPKDEVENAGTPAI